MTTHSEIRTNYVETYLWTTEIFWYGRSVKVEVTQLSFGEKRKSSKIIHSLEGQTKQIFSVTHEMKVG